MNDKRIKWSLEKRLVSELKPYSKNPRIITKDGLKHLENSFNEIGFAQPININTDNTILSGHARVQQLRAEGIKEVDVYVPDRELTPKQEEAVIVRMNKNTAGIWDMDILANEFDVDDLIEWGFSLDELGMPEVEVLDGMTDEDAVPEAPIEPVSKRGDIWILGNHRLMCGDSTMIDDVEKLMDGEKADMVFTDPPYNIDFKPQRNTHDKILNDSMSDSDFAEFLKLVFENCKIIMNPDTYLISFMGWSTVADFKAALEGFFEIKSMPIWVKNNFGIGYYTRPKYEPFFLCLNGKPIKPAKAPADVFEFNKVHKTIHSCEKPVDMIKGVCDFFNKNGLFYEPFGGSGSMLIACEQTNRQCNSMELDEKYCDVIIKRWQDYTGKEATLEATGEKYNELKPEQNNG